MSTWRTATIHNAVTLNAGVQPHQVFVVTEFGAFVRLGGGQAGGRVFTKLGRSAWCSTQRISAGCRCTG